MRKRQLAELLEDVLHGMGHTHARVRGFEVEVNGKLLVPVASKRQVRFVAVAADYIVHGCAVYDMDGCHLGGGEILDRIARGEVS